MRQAYKVAVVIGFVVFVIAASHAQSLGDVARQQRKKQADAPATRKVVTNEDIPEHAEETETTSTSTDKHPDSSVPAANDPHAAELWKARILAQKNSIASLQKQIDKLNSTIHFVEANAYTNGVQHNERQIQKQDVVERMQIQLNEQKKKLADMQESARKAGFGSSVYEP